MTDMRREAANSGGSEEGVGGLKLALRPQVLT